MVDTPSGRLCILNFICLARSSNSSVIWSLVDLFGGICGSCRFLGDGVPEGCRNPPLSGDIDLEALSVNLLVEDLDRVIEPSSGTTDLDLTLLDNLG